MIRRAARWTFRWFLIISVVEFLAVAAGAVGIAWLCLQAANHLARAPERIYRPNVRLATTTPAGTTITADGDVLADLNDIDARDLEWLRRLIRSYRGALR